jgi:hypothetical protein
VRVVPRELPPDELRLRERLLDERGLLPELRELFELDEPDAFDAREDAERDRLFDPEALLRAERLAAPLERRALDAARCDACRPRC